MRHFMFIQAIYKIANIQIEAEQLLAAYNLAKAIVESKTLAQFTFADIEWSVRQKDDWMRVSLITQGIMYSIYDGKEYKEPTIEINELKYRKS